MKEVEKDRDNRQIHNDKGKSGTSSEKETWTIGGTEQYIKPTSKKWKCLARDKGVNEVQTSSLNQSTNDKGGEHVSGLGNNSHTRKRILDSTLEFLDNTETAVVAKQPRRHQ